MRSTAKLLLMLLLLVLAAGPARAADARADGDLENWFVMLQAGGTWRSERDVFGRFTLDGEVDSASDGGLGFALGRRIGDRFVLAGQVTGFRHPIAGSEDKLVDVDALITGTVLFRERDTLQPFLRGGFGGSGMILDLDAEEGTITVFGTGAVAGGGLQILLGRHFSIELEGGFTFTNFLQVEKDTEADYGGDEDSWQVRRSAWGTRFGMGLNLWF